jgi:hypothetical protein
MQMTPTLPDNYRPFYIPSPELKERNDNPSPLVRVPKFIVPKQKIKDLK